MSVTERYGERQLPRVLRLSQIWTHRETRQYVIIKQIHRKDRQVEVHDLELQRRRHIKFSTLSKDYLLVGGREP